MHRWAAKAEDGRENPADQDDRATIKDVAGLLQLWEGGLTVIAVDKPLSTRLIPSILVNHGAATTSVLEYLRDLGHPHIVSVAGLPKNPVTKIRADAFKAFVRANRLDGGEPSIHCGDYSLEHGYTTARRLFQKNTATTAVSCEDDLVAFGVIAGLKSRGAHVRPLPAAHGQGRGFRLERRPSHRADRAGKRCTDFPVVDLHYALTGHALRGFMENG